MKKKNRHIQMMPITALKESPRNPKQHDYQTIRKSISRFGFVDPLIWDERKQCLVAGHGRLHVLREMIAAGEDAPEGIEDKDGVWLVPVERGWASASDKEHDAYLLASNRLVEKGGWNRIDLHEVLEGLDDLEGIGFTEKDLERLAREVDPDDESSPSETYNVSTYSVIVDFKSEAEQAKFIEEVEKRGLEHRVMMS